MNKKLLAIIVITISMIILVGLASLLIVQKSSTKEKETKEEVLKEDQTKVIGGVEHKIEVKKNPTQDEIVSIMHKMTHQKVIARDKWGAIEMTPENIDKVYEVIKPSKFKDKEDLLLITEKWKQGDFSEVDKDHNFFWKLQNGNIGKAFGVVSEEEEKQFIENNFRNNKSVEK
ncbi:DUF6241 domain-containing protein [Pseudobacillus wudalianchiensis]|uniref:CTP synthase n=1 Tax=Pseudobacillus wudalianchiensis TaxID=1743143 RepID=A0A1B9AUH4_9BACI|nr:DUF6241 domain-containing protein [Bacillus wudalianchiensis]OCA87454.1 hypothetical protein A8F95_09515 [Bacillus wudalianchiensis]